MYAIQLKTRKWKKPIQGNKSLKNAPDPLRYYLTTKLVKAPIEKYPERPSKVVNVSQGDPTTSPQFRTHKDNLQLLAQSVGKIDGYTNPEGLLAARNVLAEKYSTLCYTLSSDDVYLTNGGGMALWTVMSLLGDKGDNFLFPAPGYPLTLGMANILGMEPRYYSLEEKTNWQASIQQIESLIDKNTRFILVIDPSNPLGSVWSAEHKRDIIELCIRRQIVLLADEIYESMSYEYQVTPFAQCVQPNQIDRITIFKCSGLSKVYLGPGWRMGWIVLYACQNAKKHFRKYLRGIFNFIQMPNTIVQFAIPGIINNLNNVLNLKKCISMMHKNQRFLKSSLQSQHYCTFGSSSGAIFATIIIHLELFQKEQVGNQITDFALRFYAQQNVIVYPGNLFMGNSTFIRLMISCSLQRIHEFVLRFKRFCKRHLLKKQ